MSQANYLRGTPVKALAEFIDRNILCLFKASITSLTNLGSIKTEFGQIGRLIPRAITGQRKFLISEIVPVLRANADVDDGGLLFRIERFMELEDAGAVEYNITILDDGSDLVMKDGNKRAIAFFERHRGKQLHNQFDVFVLRRAVPQRNVLS